MVVSFARGALGDWMVPSFNRGKMDWFQATMLRKEIVVATRQRDWHNAAKVEKIDQVVKDRLPRPKRDLKFHLAPSRYRDPKQECDKEARERSLPGNGADG
jgi:hypothetical protein